MQLLISEEVSWITEYFIVNAEHLKLQLKAKACVLHTNDGTEC